MEQGEMAALREREAPTLEASPLCTEKLHLMSVTWRNGMGLKSSRKMRPKKHLSPSFLLPVSEALFPRKVFTNCSLNASPP